MTVDNHFIVNIQNGRTNAFIGYNTNFNPKYTIVFIATNSGNCLFSRKQLLLFALARQYCTGICDTFLFHGSNTALYGSAFDSVLDL